MKPARLMRLMAKGAMLIGLIVLACSKTPDQQETAVPGNKAPLLIEPRVGVGNIRAGMSVQQVVEQLGQPGHRTANSLEYPKLGLAVMPADGPVQVVMCGDVTGITGPYVAAFKGRTREGIGMNSTRDEVLKAFGEPAQDEKMKLGLESLGYPALGLTFTLDGGKVHHIIVRLGTNAPPASIEVEPVR